MSRALISIRGNFHQHHFLVRQRQCTIMWQLQVPRCWNKPLVLRAAVGGPQPVSGTLNGISKSELCPLWYYWKCHSYLELWICCIRSPSLSHSLTYPAHLAMGLWVSQWKQQLSQQATALSSATRTSVDMLLSCPLFKVIIPGFSLPSSSSSILNCFLKDYLGETVMTCYM